jgi:hypothetical protein
MVRSGAAGVSEETRGERRTPIWHNTSSET